jgi:ferredoxin-nitrate reductase
MVDRIADPWGERTPYGPVQDDGQWPVRVDMFLEAGTADNDVERWVWSASVLHSDGDAFDFAVRDGRIVAVRGTASDRINRGRLGPNDLFGWQAIGAPDRLRRALVPCTLAAT